MAFVINILAAAPHMCPTHIGRSPFLEIFYFAVISFKMFKTPISTLVISFFVSNVMIKELWLFQLNQCGLARRHSGEDSHHLSTFV